MAARKISQAEARRLQKQVKALEAERQDLLSRQGWICSGTHLAQWTTEGEIKGRVYAAQKLGFLLVCKIDGSTINLWAVKP